MTQISNLTNHLLIASPTLKQSEFEHSVIYVCEHQEAGAIGIIVNHPLKEQLGVVFSQLHIEPDKEDSIHLPLLYGGPNQTERGFVIHRQMSENFRSSLHINKDVTVTTSKDIITALAHDKGPADFLVTLGYAGWDEQQLENEIINDTWLVCPFHPEVLYDVPFEERWAYAGRLIGVDMNKLSSTIGHA